MCVCVCVCVFVVCLHAEGFYFQSLFNPGRIDPEPVECFHFCTSWTQKTEGANREREQTTTTKIACLVFSVFVCVCVCVSETPKNFLNPKRKNKKNQTASEILHRVFIPSICSHPDALMA